MVNSPHPPDRSGSPAAGHLGVAGSLLSAEDGRPRQFLTGYHTPGALVMSPRPRRRHPLDVVIVFVIAAIAVISLAVNGILLSTNHLRVVSCNTEPVAVTDNRQEIP